jgi:(S)-ureidoglycine aminohydrolase
MGYPKDLLSTRAIIKPGKCVLIPPEGRVKNVIPNLEKCQASILASPDFGAKHAFYVIEVLAGGGTTKDFCEKGVETFLFCRQGQGVVYVEGQPYQIKEGSYIFAPASQAVGFKNDSSASLKLIFYKQRYRPLEGYEAKLVIGNVNDITETNYDEMENVWIKDLLPANDLGFDVNFHILSFAPGGCHPFIETHIQEHSMYILQGEGVYLIDDAWVPVKKEDFIWFGPFTPQAYYAAGRERTTYIYSKDCNRDVAL